MTDVESSFVMGRQHGADQMRMIANSVGRLLSANADHLYGDLFTVAIFGTFILWTCNFGFFALSYLRKKWGLHNGSGERRRSSATDMWRHRRSNASSSSIASSSAANLNATMTNVASAGLGEGELSVNDGGEVSTENIVVDYRATGDGWGNGDENGLAETSSDFFLYVLNEEETGVEDDEDVGVYYTFLDEDEEDELQSALEDEERSLELNSIGEAAAALEDRSGVVINAVEPFNTGTEGLNAVQVNQSSQRVGQVTNSDGSSVSRHRISSSTLPGEHDQQQ